MDLHIPTGHSSCSTEEHELGCMQVALLSLGYNLPVVFMPPKVEVVGLNPS